MNLLSKIYSSLERHATWWVVGISFAIALILGSAIWDMGYWPTDTEAYFFPATIELPTHKYLSEMHASFDEERVRWLHGKELFILAASIMQRLLDDIISLRSYILVCLLSVMFGSILFYIIVRRLFSVRAGLLAFILFAGSFWPYVYILFTKHQPYGLMYFLIGAFFLLLAQRMRWMYVLAGMMMGCAFYSSTVSALYVPYFVALWFCSERKTWLDKQKLIVISLNALVNGLMMLGGAVAVIICVNYPNVGHNLQGYLDYIKISGTFNHFYYNQFTLQQWMSGDISSARGGWLWIVRYFFLIMPVMFPVYLFCVGFLLLKIFQQWNQKRSVDWKILILIGLSWSSPILAEIKGVAQYGANYFTTIIGIIFLIILAFEKFVTQDYNRLQKNLQIVLIWASSAVLIFHVGINSFVFATDVLPSRMAVTNLGKTLDRLQVKSISSYVKHPHSFFIVGQLPQKLKDSISFKPMQTVQSVKEGLILVPPMTKDSIYLAAHSDYTLVDSDLFMNELIKQNRLSEFAVASFPSLVSSRIWRQEEEILTYRDLILNQRRYQDPARSYIWLLDGAKLHEHIREFVPDEDTLFVVDNNIRNIGTINDMNVYTGKMAIAPKPFLLSKYITRIYKVGSPTDSLVAYAYYVDPKEPLFIPHKPNNASKSVQASSIVDNKDGGAVIFEFDPPLEKKAGAYEIEIYRTGKPDDTNFYRIYTEFQKPLSL